MADREKAIRVLKGHYKNSVLRHNGELVTVNELIDLLKAQEPVKPSYRSANPFCGKCGFGLFVLNVANYCPNCGRAVMWE